MGRLCRWDRSTSGIPFIAASTGALLSDPLLWAPGQLMSVCAHGGSRDGSRQVDAGISTGDLDPSILLSEQGLLGDVIDSVVTGGLTFSITSSSGQVVVSVGGCRMQPHMPAWCLALTANYAASTCMPCGAPLTSEARQGPRLPRAHLRRPLCLRLTPCCLPKLELAIGAVLLTLSWVA